LQLASNSRNLKSIIDKIQSTKANLSSHAVYLFSDFQKSMVDFSTISLDTTSTYYIIKEEAISEDNLSIDSAWFEGPFQNLGQSNILKVRLSNNSKQDIPDLKTDSRPEWISKNHLLLYPKKNRRALSIWNSRLIKLLGTKEGLSLRIIQIVLMTFIILVFL
jgi:hypothetical protein